MLPPRSHAQSSPHSAPHRRAGTGPNGVPIVRPGAAIRQMAVNTDGVATEVELAMSDGCSGGSDGQTGLGEAAVYEVAAVLDVP